MSRICRDCGKDGTQVAFKKKANICDGCNQIYMKGYRQKNKTRISGQIQTWKDENREQYRATCRDHYVNRGGKAKQEARLSKAPRVWLDKCFSAVKTKCVNPGRHSPKDPDRRVMEIDLDYVCHLFDIQNGKCALTGILMNHRPNDPLAASIDRIDSRLGYFVGNVQLVCQFANYAKRHFPNNVIKAIFEQMVREGVSELDKMQG